MLSQGCTPHLCSSSSDTLTALIGCQDVLLFSCAQKACWLQLWQRIEDSDCTDRLSCLTVQVALR